MAVTESSSVQLARNDDVENRHPGSTVSTGAAYHAAKQLADRALGLLLLILALPLLGVLVLAIRLTSKGPGIYSQVRVGRGGKRFTMYKLRSMRGDAESHTGPVWAPAGRDPRVTPLGHWLRVLHLDELPQLYNLLRGEMSLVGPRPERPEFVAVLTKKIPGYVDRLQVLPGITGLAQINLPPDSDLDSVRAKLVLDQEYIRTASLWLDLRIAACTLLRLIGLRGGRAVSLLGLKRQVALPPSAEPASVKPLPAEQAAVHMTFDIPIVLEPPTPGPCPEPLVTNHSVIVASQG